MKELFDDTPEKQQLSLGFINEMWLGLQVNWVKSSMETDSFKYEWR